MDKAREILKSMRDDDPRILKNPPPAVFVESYDANKGPALTCSFRTTPGHVSKLQSDIIDEARRRLDQPGIGNLDQIIRKVPGETDPSRFIA